MSEPPFSPSRQFSLRLFAIWLTVLACSLGLLTHTSSVASLLSGAIGIGACVGTGFVFLNRLWGHTLVLVFVVFVVVLLLAAPAVNH